MRLLNTVTKQLESFYGKNTPPYVILSHMWNKEEDEVLFKHIVGSDDSRREGESRRGFQKIAAACNQAIKDGYMYIWIDTCCIDKESSAELSEAINSMYTWYAESDICYAYLEDVWSSRSVKSDESTTFEMMPFQNSRWFKRGWTLQELVAPRCVVFYSRDWIDIGTKAILQDTISNITRIRTEMIIRYDPKKASIAERMSWAAFRETTRDEDIAYCLMGVFGVHMPLLYGEGKRAFMRLQEEIMKASVDHSIFAWTAPPGAWRETRGMLADSPQDFHDAGNIVQSADEHNLAYSPYFMTNRGLQIELPLVPFDDKEDNYLINSSSTGSIRVCRAILNCTDRSTKLTRWIIIYLEMVGKDHYVRRFPHQLGATDINPNEGHVNGNENELKLTPLLVMQITTSMNNDDLKNVAVKVKILPTESGFTLNGKGLEDGYDYSAWYGSTNILTFNRGRDIFEVAIGDNDGIPWLDIIEWGTPSCKLNAGARSFDRLSVNISKDWTVDASVKLTHRRSLLEVIVDIRRGSAQVEGWYVPTLSANYPNAGTLSGDFPVDLDLCSPGFKEGGSNWVATFNPIVKEVVDVKLVHSLRHESEVWDVQFSPDGKYLATGSIHTVQIYDTRTGIETCVLIPKSSEYLSIYSVCFSPDGKFLAMGANDQRIRIWNISEKCIYCVFYGHRGWVNSLHFSSDGQLIFSGSEDGTVRVWKVFSGTSKILTVDNFDFLEDDAGVTSIAISPKDRFIAAGSRDGIIRIWNIATLQLVEQLRGHWKDVCSIIFTPDGKGLVSGSEDGTLKYWDVSTLVIKPTQCTMNFIRHKGHCVSSVSISHDGRWVISASDRYTVLSDSRNATVQFILRGHTKSVTSVDLSPASNIFATSSKDQDVRIWSYNII